MSAWSWKRRYWNYSKPRYLFAFRQGKISQKTWNFDNNVVRTSHFPVRNLSALNVTVLLDCPQIMEALYFSETLVKLTRLHVSPHQKIQILTLKILENQHVTLSSFVLRNLSLFTLTERNWKLSFTAFMVLGRLMARGQAWLAGLLMVM